MLLEVCADLNSGENSGLVLCNRFILQGKRMSQLKGLAGKNLPAVELHDLTGQLVKTEDWKGTWTILVFLRHLG